MDHDDICDLTLIDMTALLRTRALSATEALTAHLARINQVNPVINAIVTLDPERAFAAARVADERAASGEPLPVLHGVPMTHKDTHDTAGMVTTWGSPTWRDRLPQRSAVVVEKLNAAGVITTGKSNVPELGAGSHTFNQLFGTTTNPYDPTRSAGGSSGGAAAAIAAGIQPAGDGSDMGGSIRTPASFNNLVGLRPSAGCVPMWPSSDPWSWMTRVGPLARTTADLALMMSVLATDSPELPVPLPRADQPWGRPLAADLRGARIGWSPDLGLGLPVEAEVLRVLERQLPVLEALGATVELAAPDLSEAAEVFEITRAYDFAVSHEAVYTSAPHLFKHALAANIEKGLALTSAELRSAGAARARLLDHTQAFFRDHDLFVTPASLVLPFDATWEFPTHVNDRPMSDYLGWMRAATAISATGLPCMSVPAGFTDSGLPVGMQLVAADGADMRLLDAANAIESVAPWHRRPPVVTTARATADPSGT